MGRTEKFEKAESLLSEAREKIREVKGSEKGGGEVFYDRKTYLDAFDSVCERFDLDVGLEEDSEKDEVFSEWDDHVNMTASELKKWSRNPCSREASVDPEAVIKRNLRLLEKNKEDWTDNDVEDAKRTISFISRMKANRPDSPREGPHGCPSEWAISMLNWAFNPFDSVPTPSSEVKEDLDPVDEVELQEGRKNIKEAEMLAEEVWILKDVMQEFNREFEGIARRLEREDDLEEVERMREQTAAAIDLMKQKLESPVEEVKKVNYEFQPVPDQVLYSDEELAAERAESMGLEGVHQHVLVVDGEEVVMYMPAEEHVDWAEKVRHPRQLEELSEVRKASQVIHGKQEKNSSEKVSDEGESVRVNPPVAIHKVESGSSKQVSEDVENVLDELWD